jgi:hypothetical protein
MRNDGPRPRVGTYSSDYHSALSRAPSKAPGTPRRHLDTLRKRVLPASRCGACPLFPIRFPCPQDMLACLVACFASLTPPLRPLPAGQRKKITQHGFAACHFQLLNSSRPLINLHHQPIRRRVDRDSESNSSSSINLSLEGDFLS